MVGCRGAFFGDDRLEYICGDQLLPEEEIRLCKKCLIKKTERLSEFLEERLLLEGDYCKETIFDLLMEFKDAVYTTDESEDEAWIQKKNLKNF